MDNAPDVLAFLRKGAWFGSLPDALQRLVVERATVRRFLKGEAIIRHGAAAKGMHAVLEGRVHVTWLLEDGTRALIHVGEAGLWFGEYALLASATSVGSVVAATPVRTLRLGVGAFEQLVKEDPRYYRHFAQLTLGRYAMVMRYYAESNWLPAEEWLRVRLQDLAAMQRSSAGTHGAVEIRVSQAELASLIGVSRQTLSKLLARIAERGLIEVGFRTIRVLDDGAMPQRLAR